MARFSLRFQLVAMLLALCLVGHGARAQEDWEAEEPRWIPSLSFRFDTFDYKTDTSVVNHVNPPAQEGMETNANRELQFLSAGELQGPMFEAWPGRPRLFASAGMQFNPFSSDDIFRAGEQRGDTELDIVRFQGLLTRSIERGCLDFVPPACPTMEPGEFQGQGSEIEAKFKVSWFASFGVAFSFPLGESLLLQVKPSIAYNVDQIKMTGEITTVTENDSSTWANPNVPEYTVHRGFANHDTPDHSLGPGIELGLVLFRSYRPIRASIYGDARFLWLLGDRTTTFSDPVATYEVRRDAFGIRAGAGVRLSWVGFEGR